MLVLTYLPFWFEEEKNKNRKEKKNSNFYNNNKNTNPADQIKIIEKITSSVNGGDESDHKKLCLTLEDRLLTLRLRKFSCKKHIDWQKQIDRLNS